MAKESLGAVSARQRTRERQRESEQRELEQQDPTFVVYVSYQRRDTPYAAGWLAERIGRQSGQWRVPLDIHTLRIGGNYVDEIRHEISESHVMVALFGPDFSAGRRRTTRSGMLDELTLAHDLGIQVIPFIVDRDDLPDDLPEELEWMYDILGIQATRHNFHTQMDDLIRLVHKNSHSYRLGREERREVERRYGDESEHLRPRSGVPALLITLGAWVWQPDTVLQRAGHGYRDGMTSEDLYGSVRGWWRLNPSELAKRHVRHVVAVHAGRTRGVFEIVDPKPAYIDGERWAFEGLELASGEIYDHFVGRDGGKVVPRSYGNPIRYFVDENESGGERAASQVARP